MTQIDLPDRTSTAADSTREYVNMLPLKDTVYPDSKQGPTWTIAPGKITIDLIGSVLSLDELLRHSKEDIEYFLRMAYRKLELPTASVTSSWFVPDRNFQGELHNTPTYAKGLDRYPGKQEFPDNAAGS